VVLIPGNSNLSLTFSNKELLVLFPLIPYMPLLVIVKTIPLLSVSEGLKRLNPPSHLASYAVPYEILTLLQWAFLVVMVMVMLTFFELSSNAYLVLIPSS
jgi:hypothetical protein